MQIFEPDETAQEDSTPGPQNLPDIPEPEPSFVPPPTRSGRARKFPALFKDFLPNSISRIPVPHMPPRPPRAAAEPAQAAILLVPAIAEDLATIDSSFTTEPDEFGLYRVYPRKPYHEPLAMT